jgi:TYPE I RESTRICTION-MODIFICATION SYSTEM SPECIFICITY SUBUNIT
MNRYDSYKNVDLAWLKEVPSHWEIKRLKKIADFTTGNSIKDDDKAKYSNCENSYLYISTSDINGDKMCIIHKSNIFIPFTNKQFKLAKSGSTLVCVEGGNGGKKVAFTEDNVCFGNKLCAIKAKKCFDKFIYYIVLSDIFKTYFFLSINGDRNGVSQENIGNFYLPIPPLSEQKQIADYLDWKINEIDKLIDIEREKVNQLEIYKQKIIDSLMYSINSTYIPLKVVFNFGKGLNITKDNLGENGIRCVSYGEIHNDFAFSFSSSNSKLKGLEKVKGITISKFAILQKGDFIFVDTSEDLKGCGNFTYLEDSEREVYAGYHTIVGKLKLEINSRYLAYYFESYKWRKQIREMVNGIKVYSITQSILKSSKIQIPKKEVQNQIVEKIDRFMENQEKLISIINEKIDSLISLKQSLISEVVTGKIDVRDIKIPYYEKIDISNEKQEHLEERQV